jgi:probable phosphoglycerate mutase
VKSNSAAKGFPADGIYDELVSAHTGGIILVRHGETDANLRRCFAESDDIPLTEVGRRQCRDIAARLLREFRPEVLVSSHFLRARQTSEIIANVLGLKPEAIQGIHERDFGSLKGHPYERLGEAASLTKPWLWSPPGGESLDDVRRRAMTAIEGLRLRYPGREIVVVTHGAVIQSICAHITGKWIETSVPPNCGIATIFYDPGGWALRHSSSSVPDREPE